MAETEDHGLVRATIEARQRMERARWFFASCCVATSVLHLSAFLGVTSSGGSSALRHLVFCAINVALATLFAKNVRWVLYPLVPLSLQQLVSHGDDLARAAEAHSVDWQSIFVLVFFALALVYSRWRLQAPSST
jgi:hypothetical protein